MSARIIDGKAVAAQCRAELKIQVEALKAEDITPGLAVVLVGEDPASQVYVRNKHKACEELGIHSEQYTLPENTGREELLALIAELNGRKEIDGILVQLPLPAHLDQIRDRPRKGCGRFPSTECGSNCHWGLLFCPLYAQRYSHPHR